MLRRESSNSANISSVQMARPLSLNRSLNCFSVILTGRIREKVYPFSSVREMEVFSAGISKRAV